MSSTDSNSPNEENSCPLCEGAAIRESRALNGYAGSTVHVVCANCGPYCFETRGNDNSFYNLSSVEKLRLGILLCERKLAGRSMPYLSLNADLKSAFSAMNPILPRELLREWPSSVAERIKKCLVNLVNYDRTNHDGTESLGRPIQLKLDRHGLHVLFSQDDVEAWYMKKTLTDLGWVNDSEAGQQAFKLRVTPDGWQRYEELTQGSANENNPAFVAMWFGGKNKREEMDDLFNKAIKPACAACGWRAKRADTDEHNETIMDRMIADIREAPFLIAELTGDNSGVYFEAGYARGLGKTVIYCCRDGDKPHFDVSGINQVRWKDLDDLKTRLRDRIRATMGDGPHPAR